MQEQQDQRQTPGTRDEEPPTPQEVNEALQQAMRREAATREETPDPSDQVLDSANRDGMGSPSTGNARTRRS